MPSEQKLVEEKAKAEEKAKVEQAAAASGAKAVADAVAKVAQAAVEAASKVQTVPVGDFVVTGRPGGRFEIRSNSPNLSSSGSVFVNGRPQHIDEWGADYVRGKLDPDVTSGEVVIPIDDKIKRVGYLKVD